MPMNAGLAAYIASRKGKKGIQGAAAAKIADIASTTGKTTLVPTGKAPAHMPPWMQNATTNSAVSAPNHLKGTDKKHPNHLKGGKGPSVPSKFLIKDSTPKGKGKLK